MSSITERILILLGVIAVIELGVIAYAGITDMNRPAPKAMAPAVQQGTTITMPALSAETVTDAKPKTTEVPQPESVPDAAPDPLKALGDLPGAVVVPGTGSPAEIGDTVRQAVVGQMAETLYQKCMKSNGDKERCACMRGTIRGAENIVDFSLLSSQATINQEIYGKVKLVVRERCGLAMK